MTATSRYAIASAVAAVIVGLFAWAAVAAYHPVRPRLMCQMPLGNGEVAVYFGYTNSEDEPVTVEAGPRNRLSSWAKVERLPTVFPPGATGAYPDALFVATFRPDAVPSGERLSWKLGPRTVRLTDETPRCPVKDLEVPDDIVWVKPKPVEIAKVEPEVVKEPEPTPPEPKPEVKPPEPPKPVETPPPRKAERRPPKPKNDKVEAVKSDAPVALALTGLTNMGAGGMAIQKGEFDSFGDASVVATRDTTAPREVGSPDGVAGGTGDVDRPPPKRVPARVKNRPKGEWPADAPPRAGAVLVRLSLLVGVDGRVKDVKVVRKAGPAFDREARAVGLKATFEPATVDGEPVESWVPWDVEFTPDTW